MNYTLHQLKIFLKVVQTQSITKAAEELFMTQPAVSIQLKNFQDQFDLPLTEVVGRQLYITEFGKEVALIADRVIEELESINYKSQAFKGLLTGKLSISAASTGKYVIPYFLTGFLDKYPGVDLMLDVTNKSLVIESLKKNEIDFALVSVLPEKIEVEEEVLLENKLYLMGNSPVREEKRPLIFREEGSATRIAMEQYLQSQEKVQRKRIELTSNEAVKQAVIAGIGDSIMPLIGVRNELLSQELHIIPTPGLPVKSDWRLVWLKGKKLSVVSQAFLEYLRSEKQNLTQKYFDWYLSY